MDANGFLEWRQTPLSDQGYKYFSVTQGSWQNDTFIVPIDCSHGQRWTCQIRRSIWVRIVSDEFYEVAMQLKLPAGKFRAPFYRIVGSRHAQIYEKWLRDTGVLKADDSLQEYLIASMENEVYILALEEPSFQKDNRLAK
jgi:hypothetical protein